MPFRSNFFGDKYAQPGTEISELDDLLIDKYGEFPDITGARIEDDGGDSDFKGGGEILFAGLEDDDETFVENLRFDGFESKEAAIEWLTSELKIDEDDIEIEEA